MKTITVELVTNNRIQNMVGLMKPSKFRRQDRFETTCPGYEEPCGNPIVIRDSNDSLDCNDLLYLRMLQADFREYSSLLCSECHARQQAQEIDAVLLEHQHWCPSGAHRWRHPVLCPFTDDAPYKCESHAIGSSDTPPRRRRRC
jgi:hypothetical protein